VPAPGKVGGGRAFDGVTSVLHAGGSAALTGARTFCAWVQPAPRAGLGQPVFSGGTSGRGDFFSISASMPSGGTCPFVPPDVPFIDHWGIPCYDAPTVALPTGSWHLVCYVYDGAGIVTFYGGGAGLRVAPGSEYGYLLDTLYLGSTVIGGTTTQPSLLGTLDEVTVWNRALSQGELAVLWNGGAGCAAR
jgi:hypothetical protein